MPTLTDEDTPFEIGRLLRLAEGNDVAILATGLMVAEALDGADRTRKMGISARVVNVSTLKPLTTEAVCRKSPG